MTLNPQKLYSHIDHAWGNLLPTLEQYIRIPNKSPHFDPKWQEHGHMDRAVELLVNWAKTQPIANMRIEVQRLPGRTPLICIEVAGNSERTVLLYGHLDKQPEMAGWDPTHGPWDPVIKDQKLYGRGAADDGYAIFAALTAIQALQAQNISHDRCVILIEASEESGSPDLQAHMQVLKDRMGKPALVICLDAGCGNYDQLWVTTSLRGLAGGELRVDVLTEGVHSGYASGVVPSSFRIIRQLLSRIEDEDTGELKIKETHAPIPAWDLEKTKEAALILGSPAQDYPFMPATQPTTHDPIEQLLNRTWRPALSVVGAEGLPSSANAGNVLRPSTSLKLSLRLPPNCDAQGAAEALKKALENEPPYGAKVSFEITEAKTGWQIGEISRDLEALFNQVSRTYFDDRPAAYWGEGGAIPFMNILKDEFPQAQFMVTGVLGPHSNAHGPNEFLHLPTARKITCCVANVLSGFFSSGHSR